MIRLFFKKNSKINQHEIKIDPRWVSLVDKAIEDYNSLTTQERIWFNTRVLIDAFNNGGLISYYYNSGAENIYDALDDLESLGMSDIVEIINKYNRLLCPNTSVPKNIDERNEYVNKIDENTDLILENLESNFGNQIVVLENRLKLFLNQ